jgi:hypothetical protein
MMRAMTVNGQKWPMGSSGNASMRTKAATMQDYIKENSQKWQWQWQGRSRGEGKGKRDSG